MHSRQRGAAHVPIMFFLILMVLFLGTLWFAWITLTENGELKSQVANKTAELKAADGKLLLRDHYIADVFDVTKMSGKYAGRERAVADYDGATLDGVTGVADPAAMKDKLNSFCSQLEIVSYNGLENTFNAVYGKVESYKNRIKELESERDKAVADKGATDASLRTAQQDHTSKQSQLSTELSQTSARLNAKADEKQNLLSQTQTNLNEKRDELIAVKEANTAEVKALKSEIDRLRAHNTALITKITLIHPPEVADGQVIAARNNVAQAYINLGRKDMLQPGTIFRVQNPNSGSVKAYATVVRVEQEKAEVQLSGVVDPIADQVREGDKLYNDLYTPNSSRTIFLMGRFDYPYNKPELEKLLTNLGNKVSNKMVPGVDLVILGNKTINVAGDALDSVEDSAEYKAAQGLGVEFAPLHKIRDLIKLD